MPVTMRRSMDQQPSIARRLAVPAALLCVALAACDRVGDAVDSLAPKKPKRPKPVEEVIYVNADGTESAAKAVDAVYVDPEILLSLKLWDAARSDQREDAARVVAARFTDFTFLNLETFADGGQTHEIALFQHGRTQMGFSLIPAGRFTMGSSKSEGGRHEDEDKHEVTLTRPFLIARTEVTQAVWREVRKTAPFEFEGEQLPAENVNLTDIPRFLYRARLKLPTEAQWEYACRAGTTTKYHFGRSDSGIDAYAWHEKNSDGKPHAVGQKKSNAFGLFDMHGNVFEWCADRYSTYDSHESTDPLIKAEAGDMVARGGSWGNAPTVHRAAFRYRVHPGDKHGGIGLRPLFTIPAQ